MPNDKEPNLMTMRIYNVGFGDCTLLTFHYPDGEARHLLIDFGSTPVSGVSMSARLKQVANEIRDTCGGKLHGIVASHRHRDHIWGFTTYASGKGPGDIIRGCSPDVVIQPWTEDPDAQDSDYTAATLAEWGSSKAAKGRSLNKAFVATLASMQTFAAHVEKQAGESLSALPRALRERLKHYAVLSLKNEKAVENLAAMGANKYVRYGSYLNLRKHFPGVSFKVLGPPDLNQSREITKQRDSDPDEFWMLTRFWAQMALGADSLKLGSQPLFPQAKTHGWRLGPHHTRWFTRRASDLYAEQLLAIVGMLDDVLNNTSVILLIQFGGTKLLFPGDAQIENWEYALGKSHVRTLLAGTHIYKVGHHGSRNATPKTLWERFRHRGPAGSERLCSILPTLPGVHGEEKNDSEVPRKTLVEALEKETDLIRTDEMAADECQEVDVYP